MYLFHGLLLVCTALPLAAAQQCALKAPNGAQKTAPHGGGNGGNGGGGSTKPIGPGGQEPLPTKPPPPCVHDKVASTWFAGWHGQQFPPSAVSWHKYTTVIYSFATTTPDVNTLGFTDLDNKILPDFVQTAKQNGVRVGVSIGGWGGSQYFSSAVGNAANRTAFMNTVLDLVAQYDLDQIDFDWEYPGKQGEGDNVVHRSDSANFLSFLKQLRGEKAGQNITVSAAVTITPFADTNGDPMDDVSAFADVLDYIEIMNYDIWGSWDPTVGPNAPLNDTCAQTKQGSAVSAVAAWTDANFPASQIVLGVASYGHSFTVSAGPGADGLPCPQTTDGVVQGATSFDGNDGQDKCGNPLPEAGIYDFWGLVSGGFLNSNGTALGDVEYTFDNCSQTPYVYSPAAEVMVSYDDARSFTAKGDFINNQGLLGFAMWEAGGDYNDVLLDAMNGATVCASS